MSIILRRSASIASRRALSAALLTSDPLHPAISPELPSSAAGAAGGAIRLFHASSAAKTAPLGIWKREIHFSAGPVGFRASDAALAEHAFARFDDEEKPSSAGKGTDEGLEIAKLGISEEIVSQLAAKGIKKLFPIQRAVLEPAMQGRDLIGRAKTGTGKTLAFGIPIIDKIIRYNAQHGRGRNPLALILAPTRELARQVEKEFQESSRLDTLCVYGGVPVQQQIRTLNYGVDVVVGTPGRIIDLQNRGALNLSEVQFVVLDEADQMLAVGFDEDVEKILDKLPQQRQSMMFSATMPSWIRKLTQKYLKNPATVDLVGDDDQKLAEGITLYSIISDNYSKASILGPLIKDHAKGGKCIIFTQTKRDASRLAGALSQTFGCEPLHGDIPQGARERTLAGFRNGNFNVLIATDVAARGLDIPNVDLVIHYELPSTSELFVHRSGRTGRAGKKGNAILIYSQEQSRIVRGIEQDVGGRFTELPKITLEGGRIDMFGGRGSGGFDSYDGRRSFGRGGSGSGSFGGSSFSRPRSFGDGGSGRSNDGGSGRFGGTGFGGSSNAGPGRPGSFGDSGPGRFGSFGSSGQGSSNSFGGSFSNRNNSFGGTGGGDFGKKGSDFDWPGRSFSTSS